MINRLLGIIYILLNKGTVTAGELAERFEVSVRTIYRDVENLSMAGIPVYARKGKGGGICLTERFVLDKLLVSREEQVRILAALSSLKETGAGDEGKILCKLGDFFKTEPVNWVSIDFSDWSGRRQELFVQIKEAILNRHVMVFDYYGQSGEMSSRTVEPVQLLFKDYTWYVRAFCRMRGAMRLFKVVRMKRVRVLDEVFEADESRIGRPGTDWGMQEASETGKQGGLEKGRQSGSSVPGSRGTEAGRQGGLEVGQQSDSSAAWSSEVEAGQQSDLSGACSSGTEVGEQGKPNVGREDWCKVATQDESADCQQRSIKGEISSEEVLCPQIVLRIDKKEAYRIYDRFEEEEITVLPSGDFEIQISCFLDDWMYGMILSFGPSAKVLEPAFVRHELAKRIHVMAELYSVES